MSEISETEIKAMTKKLYYIRGYKDGYIHGSKNGKSDVLDKIKGYVDHIRNTGMGKKKSLEFIEKFIEGLKAESEDAE